MCALALEGERAESREALGKEFLRERRVVEEAEARGVGQEILPLGEAVVLDVPAARRLGGVPPPQPLAEHLPFSMPLAANRVMAYQELEGEDTAPLENRLMTAR